MMAYYHADRLNYAVCGTPNRLEYDQGFFVKGGDGLADFKPIAHLYKTQVFALARSLGVPEEIVAPDADDGHVLAAADPGGVLLLRSVSDHGHLSVRPEQWDPVRPRPPRSRADARPGGVGYGMTSGRSEGRRARCTCHGADSGRM